MKTIALGLLALAFTSTLHADVRLQALPDYVQRLFLPVVPQTQNALRIDSLSIDAVLEAPQGFALTTQRGALNVVSLPSARSGYARVRAGNRELMLTLVNVVPHDAMKNGMLNGYRVGNYSAGEEPPMGFIPLSEENGALKVSDHYRMRDFQCKLDGPTKFVVLRTEALLKLEIMQHELAQEGVTFDRFTVMSGYRTPYYNAKIGNETSRSRHLYGDAMDIFIDRNRDGKMDDINRDGRVDAGDARFLLRVAEGIDNSPQWGWLKGGAGVYHANAAHGPYLHVDARGYVARWGATTRTASAR